MALLADGWHMATHAGALGLALFAYWYARTRARSGEYTFGTGAGRHAFCKHCGVRTYSRGFLEQIGGAYVSVAVASLDDLDPALLATSPIRYMDGRANNWWSPPAETRHL